DGPVGGGLVALEERAGRPLVEAVHGRLHLEGVQLAAPPAHEALLQLCELGGQLALVGPGSQLPEAAALALGHVLEGRHPPGIFAPDRRGSKVKVARRFCGVPYRFFSGGSGIFRAGRELGYVASSPSPWCSPTAATG